MNEPLTKDKMVAIIQTDTWDEGGKFPIGFLRKDIRSAVEYLKDEVIKINVNGSQKVGMSHSAIMISKLIDKAFDGCYRNAYRGQGK